MRFAGRALLEKTVVIGTFVATCLSFSLIAFERAREIHDPSTKGDFKIKLSDPYGIFKPLKKEDLEKAYAVGREKRTQQTLAAGRDPNLSWWENAKKTAREHEQAQAQAQAQAKSNNPDVVSFQASSGKTQ